MIQHFSSDQIILLCKLIYIKFIPIAPSTKLPMPTNGTTCQIIMFNDIKVISILILAKNVSICVGGTSRSLATKSVFYGG